MICYLYPAHFCSVLTRFIRKKEEMNQREHEESKWGVPTPRNALKGHDNDIENVEMESLEVLIVFLSVFYHEIYNLFGSKRQKKC